jgi:hypothetical protein
MRNISRTLPATRYLAALAIALLAGACKSESATPDKAEEKVMAAESAGDEKPPPDVAAEPTASTFGDAVAPFGPLAAVRLGMTEADVKAAVPQFWDDDQEPNKVETQDVALAYELEFVRGRLATIKITSTKFKNLTEVVAQAWGEGVPARTTLGSDQIAWFDPVAGVRAFADNYRLTLTSYMPLEELLGDEPSSIAILPGALGATIEEMRAAHPDAFEAGNDTTMFFPPTEWEPRETRVGLSFSKGKLRSFRAGIGFKWSPTGKEAVLAAFKQQWGEPRMKKPHGTDKEDLIFHARKPLIISRLGVVDEWVIEARANDDACGGPCYKGL